MTRSTLYAKGYTEDEAMAVLQPIKMEMHAVNNPMLNYSLYLSNTLLPGILMLLIMQVTIYAIYVELKEETSKEWLAMADNNMFKALVGKLLPHLLIWLSMGAFCLFLLYGVWQFPLNSGIWPMVLNMVLLVLASMAFGLFFCCCVGHLRWALSLATLVAVPTPALLPHLCRSSPERTPSVLLFCKYSNTDSLHRFSSAPAMQTEEILT